MFNVQSLCSNSFCPNNIRLNKWNRNILVILEHEKHITYTKNDCITLKRLQITLQQVFGARGSLPRVPSHDSLFHMKIAASVTEILHEDHRLCNLNLSLFSYTYTLLFCWKIWSCCDLCFPQQIRTQTNVQLYICATILVWGLVSIWSTNATHFL